MSERYYTYELIDGRNGKVFYVGKGKGRRAFKHVSFVRNNNEERMVHNPKLYNKIKKILSLGFMIYCTLIYWSNESVALEKEKSLIQFYGRDNLCNLTDGGDGSPRLDKEVIAKIQHSRRWYRPTQETKDKISKSHTGKVLSDEHREKVIKTLKPGNGRKLTFDQAVEIRNLYKTGKYSQNQLGEMYGITRIVISRIINNKSYIDSNYNPPSEDFKKFKGLYINIK